MKLSRDFAYTRYDRSYFIKNADQLDKALNKRKRLDTLHLTTDGGKEYTIDKDTDIDELRPELAEALSKGDRIVSTKHRSHNDQLVHNSRMNDINLIGTAVGAGAKIAGAGYGLYTANNANRLLNDINQSNIVGNVANITSDVNKMTGAVVGTGAKVADTASKVVDTAAGSNKGLNSLGRFGAKLVNAVTPQGKSAAVNFLNSTGASDYIDFEQLLE